VIGHDHNSRPLKSIPLVGRCTAYVERLRDSRGDGCSGQIVGRLLRQMRQSFRALWLEAYRSRPNRIGQPTAKAFGAHVFGLHLDVELQLFVQLALEASAREERATARRERSAYS
jgi:hypothetical protein